MILFHIIASLLGIALGAAVLLMTKGSSQHRVVGVIYAVSLYAVSVSGFFIQEETGGISIFHWFSVQAIVLVSAGLAFPLFLRSRTRVWPVWHLRFMIYSYLTLVLTGIVQFFDSLPLPNEALNAIVFLSLPSIIGVVATERWGVQRWREMLSREPTPPFSVSPTDERT